MIKKNDKLYTQVIEDDYIIIEFDKDAPSTKLGWHKDKNDKIIEVLEGEGWKFQYDNEIPFDLKVGDKFYTKLDEYHRIIKGKTNLVLQIREY